MVAMTEKFSREFPRANGLIFFTCLFLVLSFLSVSCSSSIFFSTDEECAIHDGSCSSCIENGCVFCLSDVEDGHVFRPEDKLGSCVSAKNLQVIRSCALHLSKWNDAFSCSDLDAPHSGEQTPTRSRQENRSLSVTEKKQNELGDVRKPQNSQPEDMSDLTQNHLASLPDYEDGDEYNSQSTPGLTEVSWPVPPGSSPSAEVLLPPWDGNLPPPLSDLPPGPRQTQETELLAEDLDTLQQAKSTGELLYETRDEFSEGRQKVHFPRLRNENSHTPSLDLEQKNVGGVGRAAPPESTSTSPSQGKSNEQSVGNTDKSDKENDYALRVSLSDTETNSTHTAAPGQKGTSLEDKGETAVEEHLSGAPNGSLRRPSNTSNGSVETSGSVAAISQSQATEKVTALVGVDHLTGSSEITVISLWCSVFAFLLLILGCFLCIRFPLLCGSLLAKRALLSHWLLRRAKKSPSPRKPTQGIPPEEREPSGSEEVTEGVRHSSYHENQGIAHITSAQQLTKRADQSRKLFFFPKHLTSRGSRRNNAAASMYSGETCITTASTCQSADSSRASREQQGQDTLCTSVEGILGHTKRFSPGEGGEVPFGGPTRNNVADKHANHALGLVAGQHTRSSCQGSRAPSLFHPPNGDTDGCEDFAVSLSLGTGSTAHEKSLGMDNKRREILRIFSGGASARSNGSQERSGNSNGLTATNQAMGTSVGTEDLPSRAEMVERRSDPLLENPFTSGDSSVLTGQPAQLQQAQSVSELRETEQDRLLHSSQSPGGGDNNGAFRCPPSARQDHVGELRAMDAHLTPTTVVYTPCDGHRSYRDDDDGDDATSQMSIDEAGSESCDPSLPSWHKLWENPFSPGSSRTELSLFRASAEGELPTGAGGLADNTNTNRSQIAASLGA
ncbi:hypothetical protein CSUI_003649 [Cystoisospora suis]|uniref:Uncharacterized protein n=1 Tax=Cystoisospora suis TaxID=483139 RepID=A0A2C6L018_9APIC|nr:hypothetical protein CSUI_003649 [Cystoisospora suis]